MAGIARMRPRADRTQNRLTSLTEGEATAMSNESAYGLWSLVIINSLVFIIFAFSFTRPRTARDWRSLGAFAAFIVALFTEMYGFPLTVYLLSGWLLSRHPGLDVFSHEAGHLWATLLGIKAHSHFDLFHLLSNALIVSGFALLASAWSVLHEAERIRALAMTGPYAHIRHPQYTGFILIMLGFLVQWPTLPTLLMFPVLVGMYVRLARTEERTMRQEFGAAYGRYAAVIPGFLPAVSRTSPRTAKNRSRLDRDASGGV